MPIAISIGVGPSDPEPHWPPGGAAAGGGTSFLLQEDGFALLQEDGTKIVLDVSSAVGGVSGPGGPGSPIGLLLGLTKAS